MTANLPFNWQQTTNFPGTFNITSQGWVVGVVQDDPGLRYQLSGGIVSNNETVPMYGGIAISETSVPNTGTNPPDSSQGGIISRATNVSTVGAAASLTGFTAFNSAYHGLITPQSAVPQYGSGQSINFIRLGSGLRIPVACASALASGGIITGQVSWDFSGQQLIPYLAAYAAATAASATYATGSGVISLTFSPAPLGAGATTANSAGIYLNLSGLTASGGAGAANVGQLAGDWPINTVGTSGTVIAVQGPAGLGAITLNNATGTIAAGGGALSVKVLQVGIGNSMVPYVNAAGFLNWNYNGTAALILV